MGVTAWSELTSEGISDSACEHFGRIENMNSIVVHRPLLVWAAWDVWWEAGDAPGLQMMLEWVCLIAETWHQAEAVDRHLEKREAVSDISYRWAYSSQTWSAEIGKLHQCQCEFWLIHWPRGKVRFWWHKNTPAFLVSWFSTRLTVKEDGSGMNK